MINGDDVRAAGQSCYEFLAPRAGTDWSAPVPGLDFTVASVVAHAAAGPLWYTLDLWGGPGDDAAFDLRVKHDASAAALLVSLRSAALACAASADAAPAGIRGFHPAGAADASGFAAMACDELLVHTDDAARGLGLRFTAGRDLSERILRRLSRGTIPAMTPGRPCCGPTGASPCPASRASTAGGGTAPRSATGTANPARSASPTDPPARRTRPAGKQRHTAGPVSSPGRPLPATAMKCPRPGWRYLAGRRRQDGGRRPW